MEVLRARPIQTFAACIDGSNRWDSEEEEGKGGACDGPDEGRAGLSGGDPPSHAPTSPRRRGLLRLGQGCGRIATGPAAVLVVPTRGDIIGRLEDGLEGTAAPSPPQTASGVPDMVDKGDQTKGSHAHSINPHLPSPLAHRRRRMLQGPGLGKCRDQRAHPKGEDRRPGAGAGAGRAGAEGRPLVRPAQSSPRREKMAQLRAGEVAPDPQGHPHGAPKAK